MTTVPSITPVSNKPASAKVSGAGLTSTLKDKNGNPISSIGKASATNALANTVPSFTPGGSLIRTGQMISGALRSVIGTDNGVEGRTPRIPGTPGSGTENGQGGNSTIFGNIGSGALGNGSGISGLANQFGLLPSLIGAQLQTNFGGPGAGFSPNPLGNLNFGSGGLGGSGSSSGSGNNSGGTSSPPPPQQTTNSQTTPDGGANTSPTDGAAKEELDQSKANGKLLENYKNLKDDTTLNKRSENIDVEDRTMFNQSIDNFKKAMNSAGDDSAKKEAINAFREDLKQQGLDPEKVLKELLGDEAK